MSGDPHLVAIERALAAPGARLLPRNIRSVARTRRITDSTKYGFWQKWSGDPRRSPRSTAIGAAAGTKYAVLQGAGDQALAASPQLESEHEGRDSRARSDGAERSAARKRHGLCRDDRAQRASSATAMTSCTHRIPPRSTCANLLGVISDDDQLILDNAINSPQRARTRGGCRTAGPMVMTTACRRRTTSCFTA